MLLLSVPSVSRVMASCGTYMCASTSSRLRFCGVLVCGVLFVVSLGVCCFAHLSLYFSRIIVFAGLSWETTIVIVWLLDSPLLG